MTIAEIHGKISEEGTNLSERKEDLLTADTFGCFRYLPAEKALISFLNTAKSFRGHTLELPTGITRAYYSFWPWVKLRGCTPCEPDVVVGIETEGRCLHLVFVEAKYRSGISSEEDEGESPNNQLARELDNLGRISPLNLHWNPELTVTSRALLFVTQDMGMPRTLIAQSLAEYQRKRDRQGDIYWTSWRFLQPILEESLRQERSPQSMAVIEDMLKLLLRKGLTVFRGVDPITSCLDLPQFYVVPPRTYTWPSALEQVGVSYKYEVKTNG
jgi:hypothetical protein